MSNEFRDGMANGLQAMLNEQEYGLDLDSDERWVIEGAKDPIAFFRHLTQLIPDDSILYFEGDAPPPEVARFYEITRAANAVAVVRDTIAPIPERSHVGMKPGVLEALVNLLGRHPQDACFRHVKAYREGKLLFTYHDAFDGCELLVSDRIPEANVQAFCTVLGVACRREPNQKRDPEQLRRFLMALQRHQKIVNRPWWKKLLFFWE